MLNTLLYTVLYNIFFNLSLCNQALTPKIGLQTVNCLSNKTVEQSLDCLPKHKFIYKIR